MILQVYDELVDEDEMTETDKSDVKNKTVSQKTTPPNAVALANRWLAASLERHTLQDVLKLQQQAPAVIRQLLNHITELEFKDVEFRTPREQLALEAGNNLLAIFERAQSIRAPAKQTAELLDRRVK